MKPDQQDTAVQLFTTKLDQNVNQQGRLDYDSRQNCRYTIENNCFHMVDTNWATVDLLWEKHLTDAGIDLDDMWNPHVDSQ